MPGTTPARIRKKATTNTSKPSEQKPRGKRGGARPGAGRPKEIFKLNADEKTLQTVEGLGKIQATTKEAAAVLGVSEVTFIDFMKRDKKARETFEYAKESGKTSLRRAQFKTALEGNATMLIWLGKQMLDQKDKHEHAGDPLNPIQHRVGVSWMTEEEAKGRGWA